MLGKIWPNMKFKIYGEYKELRECGAKRRKDTLKKRTLIIKEKNVK